MKQTLLTLLLFTSPSWAALSPESTEFFESKIRPILAQECYECHRTGGKMKAGLALDHRQALLDGGDSGPTIQPGNPAASLLIQVIKHEHEDLKMPKAGAKLEDDVIADFEQWVKRGAPDPRDQAPSDAEVAAATDWETILERRKGWWSFQPIMRPDLDALPNVGGDNHPVDRFVKRALHEADLAPSTPADHGTLVRRLSYALVGLPPNEQAQDADINALIDDYLASPQFGERWARHWMDWVRYADSHGSEGDPTIPYAWQYRDYLIRALNADVPYDQLAREHVAGDLLDNPRINETTGLNESALGTGHLRMVFHGFAPTDALDELVRFTDDQVNVFSKAFLGLTVSCARCHHHKFDPISQDDFYALYGIFASCPPATIAVDAPETEQDSERRRTMQTLKAEIQEVLIDSWLKEVPHLASKLRQPSDALKEATANAKSTDNILTPLQSKSDLKSIWDEWQRLADTSTRSIRRWDMAKSADLQAWRQDGQGAHLVSPVGSIAIEPEGESILTGIFPAGTYSNMISTKDRGVLMSPRFFLDDKYDIWMRVTGNGGSVTRYVVQNYPRNGTVYPVGNLRDNNWQWRRYSLDYWEGDHIHLEITTAADQAVLANTNATRSWFGVSEILLTKSGSPAPVDRSAFYRALLAKPVPSDRDGLIKAYADATKIALHAWKDSTLTDPQASLLDQLIRNDLLPNRLDQLSSLTALVERYRKLEAAVRVPTRAPGVLEKDPYDQALFNRGNHKQPLGLVPRRFLDAIDSTPYQKHESGRRELAEDLFRADNPLTTRVIVNRVWHHLFGQGLVATPDNFGRLGQKPSHPELLDYLATWFQDHDYSIKALVRHLVRTRTWQQDSTPSEAAMKVDPDNRLWSHAKMRRLEAEAIRDALLKVSGSLEENARYGPPVNGDAPRRSVYMRVQRNNLDPFLSTFDAPVPASTKGKRDVTNVPVQALTMLNDRSVIRLAEHWAKQVDNVNDANERVQQMFVRSLGRQPTADEAARALVFIQDVTEQRQDGDKLSRKLTDEIESLESQISELTNKANARVLGQRSGTTAKDAPTMAEPIALWDFETDLRDQIGTMHGEPKGNARVEGGMLVLNGSSFVATKPLTSTLREKTLEAWVQLERLEQAGGGVITVQDPRGVVFDSIVYAERQAKHWMAGSNGFRRTKDFHGPEETNRVVNQPVHLVITYGNDGTVTGYRNGQPYGKPYQSDGPVPFNAGDSQVLFGLRHGMDDNGGRLLRGQIDEARLYDRALSADEVAALAARDTDFVPKSDRLAAMTDAERTSLTAWQTNLAQRQAQLEASKSPEGLSSPWADFAHALFNLKEFIYVR